MAKLIFLLDGNVLNEFVLSKERMTIGRRSSNDIHIDNLAISGQHAELITVGEGSTLVDLNSTNGTLVNDTPIKKQLLQANDVVRLGKYELKYINLPEVNKPEDSGFADTMMINPNEVNAEAEGIVQKQADLKRSPTPIQTEEDVPAENPPAAPEFDAENSDEKLLVEERVVAKPFIEKSIKPTENIPRLEVIDGEGVGNQILLNRAMVKVGTQCQQLAVITKREGNYFISHVSGDHQPLINNQLISTQGHVLKNHDVIDVDGVKMEFRSE